MDTAFQPSAFQNDAFQTVEVHSASVRFTGGGGLTALTSSAVHASVHWTGGGVLTVVFHAVVTGFPTDVSASIRVLYRTATPTLLVRAATPIHWEKGAALAARTMSGAPAAMGKSADLTQTGPAHPRRLQPLLRTGSPAQRVNSGAPTAIMRSAAPTSTKRRGSVRAMAPTATVEEP